MTLGVPGDFLHPKCIEALKRVAAGAKKAGKAWGILSRDAEHARRVPRTGLPIVQHLRRH